MEKILVSVSLAGSLLLTPMINPGAIIERTKANVAKYNAAVLQEQVEIFRLQQGEYPACLDQLVEEGYFHSLPLNPYTGTADFTYDPETGKVTPPYS